MKNFFIIIRDNHKVKMNLAMQVQKSVINKGGKCEYYVIDKDIHMDHIDIPKETECILTIGGDGTMIRAAQNTFGSNIPLLGVNCGHLGYLCDLDKDTVFDAIDKLMDDEYQIEERMMLSGSVNLCEKNDGNGDISYIEGEHFRALNDIIIRSSEEQHVSRLSVYVNGMYLFAYDCDGMIISTPTGSTAYNLSAHGPIVNPETSLILLTPINPHTLNARSIILDQDDVVSVRLIPRTTDKDEKVVVTFDGKHKQYLREDDKLVVGRAKESTKMVMLSSENFLDRIRNKMQAD